MYYFHLLLSCIIPCIYLILNINACFSSASSPSMHLRSKVKNVVTHVYNFRFFQFDKSDLARYRLIFDTSLPHWNVKKPQKLQFATKRRQHLRKCSNWIFLDLYFWLQLLKLHLTEKESEKLKLWAQICAIASHYRQGLANGNFDGDAFWLAILKRSKTIFFVVLGAGGDSIRCHSLF